MVPSSPFSLTRFLVRSLLTREAARTEVISHTLVAIFLRCMRSPFLLSRRERLFLPPPKGIFPLLGGKRVKDTLLLTKDPFVFSPPGSAFFFFFFSLHRSRSCVSLVCFSLPDQEGENDPCWLPRSLFVRPLSPDASLLLLFSLSPQSPPPESRRRSFLMEYVFSRSSPSGLNNLDSLFSFSFF